MIDPLAIATRLRSLAQDMVAVSRMMAEHSPEAAIHGAEMAGAAQVARDWAAQLVRDGELAKRNGKTCR